MTAVGEADGRGLLTEAQLAKALEVGGQAETALNAAKDSLRLYLQFLDATSAADLASQALESEDALRALGGLLRGFGVKLPAGSEQALANLARIARELGGGR
jgi:hypothetical protein